MTDDNKHGKMPEDGPWLFQDALAHLGWDADPKELADRVRRLDRGIPAEDEFAAVCAWLGKCTMLHKLDQVQVPATSKAQFQVPDILARFSTQSNDRPVLIEVKVKDDPQLRFSKGYMAKLQAYANLMGMPLLIAWKHHGVWSLFETKHLVEEKGNFYADFLEVMKQNLMGVLAGDVGFVVGSGAGVHLRMRKDELVSELVHDGKRIESWQGAFDQVQYTTYTGETVDDLDGQVQAVFMCADLEEQSEDLGDHIWFHYVGSDETGQFGHRALVELLDWELAAEGGPRWRHVARRGQITVNMANLTEALQSALDLKMVRYILSMVPQTMPNFVRMPVLGRVGE